MSTEKQRRSKGIHSALTLLTRMFCNQNIFYTCQLCYNFICYHVIQQVLCSHLLMTIEPPKNPHDYLHTSPHPTGLYLNETIVHLSSKVSLNPSFNSNQNCTPLMEHPLSKYIRHVYVNILKHGHIYFNLTQL